MTPRDARDRRASRAADEGPPAGEVPAEAGGAPPSGDMPGDMPDEAADTMAGVESWPGNVSTGGTKEELADAIRRADENWDRYLRAEADLDNFRKRSVRLRDEAVARQRRELLERFLDVVDNLERALAHSDSDPEALSAGVEGMYREMTRLLGSQGVVAMAALDAPFDPNLHHAVSVVPLPGASEERVISVERTGYTIDGELLRPARVVVSAPSTEAGTSRGKGDDAGGESGRKGTGAA